MPSPYVALHARADLNMLRAAIPETGRYYHRDHTIVLRTGLLLERERRILWHEIVHADHHDQRCGTDLDVERAVEAEAAQRAMPITALEWAFAGSLTTAGAASLLKLPEPWVRRRIHDLHPAGKRLLADAAPEFGQHDLQPMFDEEDVIPAEDTA